MIVTGIDITERRRLEKAILEVSAREQRRIGEDLHDGLGQHLTGIAFMSKVLESKLSEKSLPETGEAAKIVKLVNEAINKTRELSRGLLPVVSDAHGLMSALTRYADEMQDLFRIQLPVRMWRAGSGIRREPGNSRLPHRARGCEQCNQTRKTEARRHRLVGIETARGASQYTDDGQGISEIPANNAGMGLNIMRYRANMIGGSLSLGRSVTGGTSLVCVFPLDARS